jgi:sugar phosphate isomerase/epimerase
MTILSLAALTILDAGPDGQIEAAAAGGFRSVGLRLQPLLSSDRRVVGDPALEARVRDLMLAHDMALLEVGVFPILPDMDPAALEPVLVFTAELGGRFVVCPVEDPDVARRLETFGRLSDLCTRLGLAALVEFNPYSACRSLAEAAAMLDAVGRSSAGLVIDALHLSRSGGHPRDLASVAPERLKLVHFCDAPAFVPDGRSAEELRRESRTARLLPGEGELWLKELIAALPPETPISIEAPSARMAGLPAAGRARLALEATERFLRG